LPLVLALLLGLPLRALDQLLHQLGVRVEELLRVGRHGGARLDDPPDLLDHLGRRRGGLGRILGPHGGRGGQHQRKGRHEREQSQAAAEIGKHL
jgi:hypothetical protein